MSARTDITLRDFRNLDEMYTTGISSDLGSEVGRKPSIQKSSTNKSKQKKQ